MRELRGHRQKISLDKLGGFLMAELIIKGILGILLLATAWQDLWTKRISIWMIGIGAVLICVSIPFSDQISIIDRACGALVGVGILITSKASRGKIGMGDGYLLCVSGISLGFWGNMELFAIALFAAALVAILLLIFRLADRKKSIPFVPFLFLSYLLQTVATRPWKII